MRHDRGLSKRALTLQEVPVSCEHGLRVYLVDGSYVRNNIDSDFIQGSGWNAKYIPKGEIWIDWAVPPTEVHHLIENECRQAEELRKGKRSFVGAYNVAKKVEDRDRKKEARLAKMKSSKSTPWKKDMGLTCKHGLKVFAVDGEHVRAIDCAFIQGGNEFRYGFVPKGELWVDWNVPEEEWPYVLFHECYETEKMRGGWSYDRAHNAAKRAENVMRRQDRPGENVRKRGVAS
jgi:hypothetical protein